MYVHHLGLYIVFYFVAFNLQINVALQLTKLWLKKVTTYYCFFYWSWHIIRDGADHKTYFANSMLSDWYRWIALWTLYIGRESVPKRKLAQCRRVKREMLTAVLRRVRVRRAQGILNRQSRAERHKSFRVSWNLAIVMQQCRNYLYDKSWTKCQLSLIDSWDKIVL